jgi:formate dehydrogenase accessory protein FdhD
MAGPSGCGLCGIESIEQVTRDIAPLQSQALPSQVALDKALTDMRARQVVSQSTSGAHAAVWCDMEGNIVSVREDVGRHNALDKLIGWRSLNPTNGFVLVSSRASYEMVAKAATAGIGVLAAVSAPTSMAIDTAKSANLKLIAFASSGRHAVYA